jgi:CDP-paratose 2-epimerase
MKYLITGGCGFLGTNLAAEVIRRGEELVVLDDLSRDGSKKNLVWLKGKGQFDFYQVDIRNSSEVDRCIKDTMPDVLFHVAGQVAMSTSLNKPRYDFEVNVVGTFNILESVKKYCPECKIIYSSTNKVYGDLEYLTYKEEETRFSCIEFPNGISEATQLDFSTPYGCSKGAADQYVKDWANSFGLKTVTLRHSSIFGGRQFANSEQGWIGWFISKALEFEKNSSMEPFTIQGNGKQVRDVLFSEDLVSCYWAALEKIELISGEAFNIGGGVGNSLSIIELLKILEEDLDVSLKYVNLAPRKSDQKVFISDNSKANRLFGWEPIVKSREGIRRMIKWVKDAQF